MLSRAVVTAFVATLTMPGVALALTAQGKQMIQNWNGSNHCAQAAQKAFPDYTPESNAKRDAQLKQCLAGSNLPPRPSLESPSKP